MNGTLLHPQFGKNMRITVMQVSQVNMSFKTKVEWNTGVSRIRDSYFFTGYILTFLRSTKYMSSVELAYYLKLKISVSHFVAMHKLLIE